MNKDQEFDAVIVGCGASGIACALSCNYKDKKVAIIDKNAIPAKKLLVTGNGRCNLTNINMSSEFYNINIDKYLSLFNEVETIKILNKLGVVTKVDDEGRVYPITDSAQSVVSVLNGMLKKSKIKLFLNTIVKQIYKKDSNFVIVTNDAQFLTKKLVISLGKSDEILSDLGVKYEQFSPSLVALKTKEKTENISGVRVDNVVVSSFYKDKNRSEEGEILFKDNGLSGIVIFNLSSMFARAHDFNGKIVIDLLPKYSKKELTDMLYLRKDLPNNLLVGLLHEKICKEIYTRNKLSFLTKNSELKDNDIDNIANTIKNFAFNVVGFYENNQVFSGGISLDDLTDNLESKKIKNLYFCGEICNVDGVCGGYNLQWAFTSGHIVGNVL